MSPDSRRLRERAEEALGARRYDVALASLQGIIAENPRDWSVLERIGDVYTSLGSLEAARRCYREVAAAYTADGDEHRALRSWKKVLRVSAKDVEARSCLAGILERRGLKAEAKRLLEGLVDDHLASESLVAAQDFLQRLTRLDPYDVGVRLKIAELYLRLGRHSLADGEYVGVAGRLVEGGREAEAIQLLQTQLRSRESAPLRERLCRIHIQRGEFSAAVDCLEEVRRSSPTDRRLLAHLGEAYFFARRYADAKAIFVDLEATGSSDSQRVWLGRAALELGEAAEAYEAFSPVVDRLVLRNKAEQAAKLLESILRRSPDHVPSLQKLVEVAWRAGGGRPLARAYGRLAQAHLAVGSTENAKAVAEALARMEPEDPDHLHLVAGLLGPSRTDEADEHVPKAADAIQGSFGGAGGAPHGMAGLWLEADGPTEEAVGEAPPGAPETPGRSRGLSGLQPSHVSQRLRAIVESTYPTPIASVFARARRDGRGKQDVQLPAAAIEATVRFLSLVVLADALALEEDAASRTALVAFLRDDGRIASFSRVLTGGTWPSLLTAGLTALAAASRECVLPDIRDWYEGGGGRQLLEALPSLRNPIHQGAAEYGRLAEAMWQLLASVSFLSKTRLVWAESVEVVEGRGALIVRSFEGADLVPLARRIDISECPDTDRVYLVAPESGEMLCLDPFLRYLKCAECADHHLFTLQRVQGENGRYATEISGHRASAKDVRSRIASVLTGGGTARRTHPSRLLLYLDEYETSPTFSSGQVLAARYEIKALIGEGAVGQVYEAGDKREGREVAVKVLPHALLRDSGVVARFRAEAAQACRFDHPRITRLLDRGEIAGDHYMVMELATGWTLADGTTVRDLSRVVKPLSVDHSVRVASQVLEALDYLHSRGIVHRDVKPGNVLLFDDGSVKLSDFGIARSRESLTLTITGQILGTPEYISPEQAEGVRDPDGRADLYAVGILLFEMLSGTVPFSGPSQMSTILKHRDPGLPAPSLLSRAPEAPKPLAEAVRRALEKDPDRRFPTALSFYEALQRIGSP